MKQSGELHLLQSSHRWALWSEVGLTLNLQHTYSVNIRTLASDPQIHPYYCMLLLYIFAGINIARDAEQGQWGERSLNIDSGISPSGVNSRMSKICGTLRIVFQDACCLPVDWELFSWCTSLSGDQWHRSPQAGAISATSLQPPSVCKEGAHDSENVPEATL